MTKCTLSLHPQSLDPFQTAKAWFLNAKSKLEWTDVRKQVRTVSGQAWNGTPSLTTGHKALETRLGLVRERNLEFATGGERRRPVPHLAADGTNLLPYVCELQLRLGFEKPSLCRLEWV